jgi:hypothetical protein
MVVSFSIAHAPKRIAPIVSLDQLSVVGLEQELSHLGVFKLFLDDLVHHVDLDVLPQRTQQNMPSHPFSLTGSRQIANQLPRTGVQCLRRLKRMLGSWVDETFVFDFRLVEIGKKLKRAAEADDHWLLHVMAV